jgi:hypothetical protein
MSFEESHAATIELLQGTLDVLIKVPSGRRWGMSAIVSASRSW